MIEGKVIVITGASSGIGEATAKRLAARGGKVALGARRADKLDRLAKAIRDEGGEAVFAVTDVTKAEDNEALVRLALKEFGRVDVTFLNAGIMPTSPLSMMRVEEWHETVSVNITGVLNGVAAALPIFLEQKSGHVIATSSVAGLKSYPGGAVYGSSKWFLRNFLEVLRMESAQEGTNIRTTNIYPAAINTELVGSIKVPSVAAESQKHYDLYGISAERIASVVEFAIDTPTDTTINELTVGPAAQPW